MERLPGGINRSIGKMFSLFTHKEKVRVLLLTGALLMMALIQRTRRIVDFAIHGRTANPAMVETNTYLHQAFVWWDARNVNEFLFDLGLLTLGIALLSNVFALAVQWTILRFSHGLGYSLSLRVSKMYLRQPYAFFLTAIARH